MRHRSGGTHGSKSRWWALGLLASTLAPQIGMAADFFQFNYVVTDNSEYLNYQGYETRDELYDEILAQNVKCSRTLLDTADYGPQNTCAETGAGNLDGYYLEVIFTSTLDDIGNLGMRFGQDWGLGGVVFLDNEFLVGRTDDLWWDYSWDSGDVLAVTNLELEPGLHRLELFGFENCCGGNASAQYTLNNVDWAPFAPVLGDDADGDGVPDSLDQCPGSDDFQDSDHDGNADACDICPHDPKNDEDGDEICGDVDNCPQLTGTDPNDEDQDGIGDMCDACPNDPHNDIDQDGLCAGQDTCDADGVRASTTFSFGTGAPFAGSSMIEGVSVSLTSQNTEPFGETSFRNTGSGNAAPVQFDFGQPIYEFAIKVSYVNQGEYLTAFSIRGPDSITGDLIADESGITTSRTDDAGSGWLIWYGLETTSFQFEIRANEGAALAVDELTFTTALPTWFLDVDGDGYGYPDAALSACSAPEGMVDNATDCNDEASSIHPDAVEVCNGIDDNCNEAIDDIAPLFYDGDGDGFGDPEVSTTDCSQSSQYTSSGDDCNDTDATIHPGSSEVCNGVDDNCVEGVDEGAVDADEDGTCDLIDSCPNSASGDADEDGVCDDLDQCLGADDALDQDRDQVPDACDNCPTVKNADQADADGNDIGDACDETATPVPDTPTPEPTATVEPETPTATPEPSPTSGIEVGGGACSCNQTQPLDAPRSGALPWVLGLAGLVHIASRRRRF